MKPGHRCRNPFGSQINATNIKAGERVEFNGWELWSHWSGSNGSQYCYYRIGKARAASDVYEFSNINCAAAKLLELGGGR
jgi:hypothetical protein